MSGRADPPVDTPPRQQGALRRRLLSLCSLTKHESVKVRSVVLENLVKLLKENRQLIRMLVESEEASSTRFLTVVKQFPHPPTTATATATTTATATPGNSSMTGLETQTEDDSNNTNSSKNGGGVSFLLQSLLQRCMVEDDRSVKLLLGACLGELGAIDPNRFTNSEILDSNSNSSSPSLKQKAPWKSHMVSE